MPRITALPPISEAVASDDLIPIHNTSVGDTEKISVADLTGYTTTGWIFANETWTYVSGTGTKEGVFKITGVDLTGKYQAGDKIKFTQTQVKYAIITKVELSGSDTQITVFMSSTAGTVDNSGLTNAAISANYWTRQKSAFSFPLDPTRWTVTTTNSSDNSQSSPSNGTWYNAGSLNISIPTGSWVTSYQAPFNWNSAAAQTDTQGAITLSTANNSESDADFTSWGRLAGASATQRYAVSATRTKTLNLTSATTYYLNEKSIAGTISTIGVNGTAGNTIIKAVCAYL